MLSNKIKIYIVTLGMAMGRAGVGSRLCGVAGWTGLRLCGAGGTSGRLNGFSKTNAAQIAGAGIYEYI